MLMEDSTETTMKTSSTAAGEVMTVVNTSNGEEAGDEESLVLASVQRQLGDIKDQQENLLENQTTALLLLRGEPKEGGGMTPPVRGAARSTPPRPAAARRWYHYAAMAFGVIVLAFFTVWAGSATAITTMNSKTYNFRGGKKDDVPERRVKKIVRQWRKGRLIIFEFEQHLGSSCNAWGECTSGTTLYTKPLVMGNKSRWEKRDSEYTFYDAEGEMFVTFNCSDKICSTEFHYYE